MTPLFFALVALPLARAVRTGSARAFGCVGLVLGLSLYGYQADRILPVLVVSAVLLALPFPSGPDRKRALATGLALATILAAVVALPLLRYAVDSPASFWGRAAGRITGRDGSAEALSGYGEAIRANGPTLLVNLGRTLAMPFYRTDRSWFSGVPSGAPGLDPFASLLVAVGLWVQVRRGLGTRDPATWLPVLGLVVGLFPSALAVSRPDEVPHASRSGGALPFAAALAGSGAAALLGAAAGEKLRSRRAWIGAAGVAVPMVLGTVATAWNARVYWIGAMGAYRASSQPHRRAGEVVREFDLQTGARGNVFVLPWPNWLDHRAVLLESGRVDFDVVPGSASDEALADLISRKRGASRFVPDLPALFLVHPSDGAGLDWLRRRYPEGAFEDLSRQTAKPLGLFRVPGSGSGPPLQRPPGE